MDRVAIFVDAGYLFAAGSILVAGEKFLHGQINLNQEAMAKFVTDPNFRFCRCTLLTGSFVAT